MNLEETSIHFTQFLLADYAYLHQIYVVHILHNTRVS